MRAWRGVSDLAGALVDVAPARLSRETCLRPRAPASGGARCYVVGGRVAKILFTRFEPPDDEGDDAGRFCTFKEVPRSVILEGWCENDSTRLQALDAELRGLCATWGTWLLALDAEPQPFYRIDAFVWWDDGWRLTTGEITELGGSFLGWRDGPRVVFEAVLRSWYRDGALEAWEGRRRADDATPDRSPTPGRRPTTADRRAAGVERGASTCVAAGRVAIVRWCFTCYYARVSRAP